MSPLLSLTAMEAQALRVELEGAPETPELDGVRGKLTRVLGPTTPDPIPGQTTIDDHLEAA